MPTKNEIINRMLESGHVAEYRKILIEDICKLRDAIENVLPSTFDIPWHIRNLYAKQSVYLALKDI